MTGKISLAVLLIVIFASSYAAQPDDFLAQFRSEALQENEAFDGFDAKRGESFFKAKTSDWSCATCHTDDPRQPGKHVITERGIKPLAPAANAERFSNPKKVAKWFKRNCKDVVKRECSSGEKGDVLTYLLSLKN